MKGTEQMENPILTKGFAVAGQTRHLTCSEPLKPNLPQKIPARIKEIIATIGLRYRPSESSDLEAHAGKLALLAVDCADLPPHILEAAGKKWASTSPWLPKASDLIALCQSMVAPPAMEKPRQGETYAHVLCDKYNQMVKRAGCEWFVNHSGDMQLRA
jgi:hypothetical protein